jgi:hypothetical protein
MASAAARTLGHGAWGAGAARELAELPDRLVLGDVVGHLARRHAPERTRSITSKCLPSTSRFTARGQRLGVRLLRDAVAHVQPEVAAVRQVRLPRKSSS